MFVVDGFRKVVHLSDGAIKCETDDVEFHHQYFVRGEEHLLEMIKRKSSIGVSCMSSMFLESEKLKMKSCMFSLHYQKSTKRFHWLVVEWGFFPLGHKRKKNFTGQLL